MKLIKFLLLVLIFAGGIYVGNVYLPQKDPALKMSVAMPELNLTGFDFNALSVENAIKKLKEMPLGDADKKYLEDAILLQDYRAKKYIYAVEIAKNNPDTNASDAFVKAANDFNSSKKNLESRWGAPVAPEPTSEEEQK